MSRITTMFALASAMACTLPLQLHAQNTQIPIKSYGQELVDRAVAKNPDLLVIVMHGLLPDSKEAPIVASNIGRIGKPADEDDMRVITTEKTNLEVAPGGQRFEVELVLRDMDGGNIGALGLVFPYKEGDSKQAFEQKAISIRDDLARHILNAGNLLQLFPYDARATTKTHAQKLVDQTLAKYPEVTLLAIHVTPPKAEGIINIASNFGRHGKKGDEEDTQVISSGKPQVDMRKRFRAVLPLRDTAGKTVGTLNVGLPSKPGDDQGPLLAKAEKIRDELQPQIPSVESLVELDP